MDTVKVIHDREGQTLTVWFGKPSSEATSSDSEHGVVVMKDQAGAVIGIEVLGYTGQPMAIALEVPGMQTASR